MNTPNIKLQVELLRALQKTITKWEKGEYAEMLPEDERDTLILNTLLDAVYNVFIECSPDEQCPECLVKGLYDRLFIPSRTVSKTKDGYCLQETDTGIDDVIAGMNKTIEALKRLLDEEYDE